jgi:hypothetical protein
MSFTPRPDITMTGYTPGAASGESVELVPNLVLTNGDAFTVTVRLIATGVISGTRTLRSFTQRFSVRRDSGTTTVAATNTQETFGDAGASSWTMAVSAGAGPDRLSIVFTTGSTTSFTRVVADVFLTRVVTPAGFPGPPTGRAFVQPEELTYDSTTDYMWVGDPNLSAHADIPAFQAATRTPVIVTDASTQGWTSGATRIIVDGTHVYASNWFKQKILILNKTTGAIIGVCQLSAGFGGYDLATDGTYLYAISLSANAIQRFTIATAISDFPAAYAPDATTSVSRDFRCIVWSTTTNSLWAAAYVSSSQAVVVQLTSGLSESSVTTYSIDTNPTTAGAPTYHGAFADSSVWICIGHGNLNAPNYNWNSTPGTVLREPSTFIFLSATAPAPASGLPQSNVLTYDPYHDTILVCMSNGNTFGAENVWRIAASSNTQASVFGNAGVNGRAMVAAAEPTGLWVAQYDFSPHAHLDIYSTGIGTEALLTSLTTY